VAIAQAPVFLGQSGAGCQVNGAVDLGPAGQGGGGGVDDGIDGQVGDVAPVQFDALKNVVFGFVLQDFHR
jgi:hypothetical protein